MIDESSDENVKKVDIKVLTPHVRIQVQAFLSDCCLGLSVKKAEVLNPLPSFYYTEGDLKDCDRFQLSVPYAGTAVEFMVVFQASNPECPPDFVFSDPRFFVPLNEIESLVSWDVNNPKALLLTIREVIQAYKKKQLCILEEFPMHLEYLSLFQMEDFDEDDIEVIVPVQSEVPVHFLIRLHVDLHSYFSDFFHVGFELENYPLLLVIFPDRNSSKNYQRLYLSENLKKLLAIGDNFQISDRNGNNFVPQSMFTIQEELKSQCEISANRYYRRRNYIVQFLTHFLKSIVEYDVLLFSSLSVLLNDDGFHYLLKIELSNKFPTETPTLTFRSVYHTYNKEPITVIIKDYPYSAYWPMKKVLQETATFIKEYVEIFRNLGTYDL